LVRLNYGLYCRLEEIIWELRLFFSVGISESLYSEREITTHTVCLHATILYLLSALIALLFGSATAQAAQVTIVPPFVGTHSETWERFGLNSNPSGASILGGIATISGVELLTAHSFRMCTVIGRPSDGTILVDQDRPNDLVTISFSVPVSAFGAYWGSGLNCPQCCGFADAPSILTFRDINGNVIGRDSFSYRGDGTLMWRGYTFATPVKTIIRTAGDGQEGFAMDGLQARVAPLLPPRAVLGDINRDGNTDFVLYNASTRRTGVWYMKNNVLIGSAYGPTIPVGWRLVDVADFDRDGHPDYVLFRPDSGQTAIWYLAGVSFLRAASGPTTTGWQLIATADFNSDGRPDYLLYKPATKQTGLWYLNNTLLIGAVYGPTLPTGWSVAGVADFDRDGKRDYLLFHASTRQSAIWYLSGAVYKSSRFGPTIAAGYQVIGTADFNRDTKPDYLLFGPSSRRTFLWYLDNNVFKGASSGPTLTASWSWPAP
jgi:hypothetical protein